MSRADTLWSKKYKAVRTSAGKNAMPFALAESPGSLRSMSQARPDVVLNVVGKLIRSMLTEEKEGMRVNPVKANMVREGP